MNNTAMMWDNWNLTYGIDPLSYGPSRCRLAAILTALEYLQVHDASILEVGCGTGWVSEYLTRFGKVTACDLGERTVAYAREHHPEVTFHCEDIFNLPFTPFDVVVTLDTLSVMADQPAFINRLAELLKPLGLLLIVTQNKPVFDHMKDLPPSGGWLRNWTTIGQLKKLVGEKFNVLFATSLHPVGKSLVLLKERLWLGQSLFVVASRKTAH
jgi:2-polyprenyl-3-methyl-5-hydroxy-6-metoxy-1,4-benzoquinol methylase